MSDSEAEELRGAYSAARKDYKGFVSTLERDVLTGDLALNANVGPELWMDGMLKIMRDGKEKEIAYRINLNTVTPSFLSRIMGSVEVATKVVDARDALGFVHSEKDLARYISAEAVAFLREVRMNHKVSDL